MVIQRFDDAAHQLAGWRYLTIEKRSSRLRPVGAAVPHVQQRANASTQQRIVGPCEIDKPGGIQHDRHIVKLAADLM